VRDDVQPVSNQKLDRFLTGTVTVLPFVGLGIAGWQMWNQWLHWYDLVAFLAVYIPTGLGITVGFHRLFTHRSFKTGPITRGVLAALGSAAIEGPVVAWVADHRKHHAFSDEEGDPHSPHVDRRPGILGALHGLWHAHVGWMVSGAHHGRASAHRFAPDLVRDRPLRWVNRTFPMWVAITLVAPALLGFAISGFTLAGALTGLLWGGLVRVFLLHHVTWSINSVCHFFGRRRFDTDDESRNVFWLALPSLGEAWHHNHHAFPTSAFHGLRRLEQLADPAGLVIAAMERLGLIWNVVRVSAERQAQKALPATG